MSDSKLAEFNREAMLDIAENIERLEKIQDANPLLRFRKINSYQIDFLNLTQKFQAFFGGNKTGKTAVITYKMVLMALNQCPGFPHKARKGKPLKFIFIGPDKDVITDSIVTEIKKWCHDWQVKVQAPGGKVEKMFIYLNREKTIYTEILFKSAVLGPTAIVSYNVHAAFIDEPCQEEILSELMGRCVQFSAPLIMGFTRTPKHTGGRYAWLKQLYQGLGRFQEYKDKGRIGIVVASIESNKLLSDEQISDFTGMFAPDSPEYRMRVYGVPEEAEGLVYNFAPYKDGKPWNVVDMEYVLKNYTIDDPYSFTCYGAIDYGKSAPFAGLNVLFFSDDSILIVRECYARQLEVEDQITLYRSIFDYWNVRPLITVADDQITHTVEVVQESIYDKYVQLFKGWTTLEADIKNKLGKIHSIADLGSKLVRTNPKTGRPYIQILNHCDNLIRELSDLTWSGNVNLTRGDDHAESALRYLLASGYGYYDFQRANRW